MFASTLHGVSAEHQHFPADLNQDMFTLCALASCAGPVVTDRPKINYHNSQASGNLSNGW